MVWVEALVPFDKGELLSTIHQVGMVERTVSIITDGLRVNFCFVFFSFMCLYALTDKIIMVTYFTNKLNSLISYSLLTRWPPV